ncbi:ATP-binding protein [Actinophytocola sp.]|uniref:ATP-binding protein n=1 Tax=Actinophytocola sp. TaxID=1872138 RepID=UPI002ED43C09
MTKFVPRDAAVTASRIRVHGIEELGASVPGLVARLAAATGLTHSQAYRMRLAAEEITTNTVVHGYLGGDGWIDIDGGFDRDWVWMRFEDVAPEFDPTAYDPAPRLAMDPRAAPLGGLGVFLAVTSVDSFEHSYTGGRNRNLLKMRRAAV